ncbi:hypothetical protein GH816_08910 [Betaproteobacteria bacterium LSUCC0115]|nr:hypothetical protein [Burkholderiales bacterium LSUCC0115]
MARVGQTGGLGWHLKAWRYRQRLWAGYLQQTKAFLEDWSDQSLEPAGLRRLVIVGASAGWSLPTGWVRAFDELVLIDPDPLAPWLFGRNHSTPERQHREWIREDFRQALPPLLAAPKPTAVLFNNLLGQLRLTSKDLEATEAQLGELKTQLDGVHWASFHDRLSGDWGQAQQSGGTLFAEGSVNNACLTKTYAKGGQWLDHLTADVLPQTSRRWVYPWRITPDRLHIVEAGWVAPAGANAGPFEPDQA